MYNNNLFNEQLKNQDQSRKQNPELFYKYEKGKKHKLSFYAFFSFIFALFFFITANGCNQSSTDSTQSEIGNPYVALVMSPKDGSVLTGENKQFAVNAIDLEGNYKKIKPQWSVTYGHITDEGVFVAPAEPGYALVTAKYDGLAATTQLYVKGGSEIVSFYIVPESGEIEVARSVQFTCYAKNAAGDFVNVNPSWSCENGNITNTGFYSSPTKPKTDKIKAQLGRLEAYAYLNVISKIPGVVRITPNIATVAAGQTCQFSAQVYDDFGNTVILKDILWSATYGTITQDGLYTCPTIPAAAQVFATAGGATGTAYVNTGTGATATSIDITPPNAVLKLTESRQFTAIAYDANNAQTALPGTVTWSTDNGTITQTGLYVAQPATTGLANIKAVCGAFSKQIVVLVTN